MIRGSSVSARIRLDMASQLASSVIHEIPCAWWKCVCAAIRFSASSARRLPHIRASTPATLGFGIYPHERFVLGSPSLQQGLARVSGSREALGSHRKPFRGKSELLDAGDPDEALAKAPLVGVSVASVATRHDNVDHLKVVLEIVERSLPSCECGQHFMFPRLFCVGTSFLGMCAEGAVCWAHRKCYAVL